ncbi:DNA repair protein RadC [Pontiellaceae bacterium B12227]|nr:DNA repair protein RadC [Pontiellaceae bacterium B12227]MDF7826989.1 DNA repair protein RadC [Pontiellaceae bacterium B12227]
MVLQLQTELAVKEAAYDGTLLTTPEHVEAYLSELKSAAQECFVVIALNAKNKVIEKHLVSLGTVSSALVHPREVFRALIQSGASTTILAHNHPSGDSTPSSEDIKITRQLISAGEIMGIKVLDHIVIGNTALSLRESGLCHFQ